MDTERLIHEIEREISRLWGISTGVALTDKEVAEEIERCANDISENFVIVAAVARGNDDDRDTN